MTTTTKHIRFLLFLSLCVVMVSCQDRNEYVEPLEVKQEATNQKKDTELNRDSLELISVKISSVLTQKTFDLNLVITNNTDKNLFFINNLWVYEYTKKGVTMSDVVGDLRFNSICFYENELVASQACVVESKMSMYSEKDISIIEAKNERDIKISWLIDDDTKKVLREKDIKYLVRLVFTDNSFDIYEDEDIFVQFDSRTRNGIKEPNGYSNSSRDERVYLGDWNFYFKKLEGKIEL